MKAWVRAVVMGVVLLFAAPMWAQEAPKVGGTIVVDDKAVEGAHYLLQGRTYLFPIELLGKAMNRQVTVDAASHVVVWDGQSFNVDIMTVDDVAYVSWLDLNKMAPTLKLGVGGGRAVFDTKGPKVAQTPRPKASNAPDSPVSVLSQTVRADPNRANNCTFELVLQSNIPKAIDGIVVQLIIFDTSGKLGGSTDKPVVYAQYQQPLTLAPNEMKHLVFESDLRDPQSTDSGAQTVTMNLSGLGPDTIQVVLNYTYRFQQQKPPGQP